LYHDFFVRIDVTVTTRRRVYACVGLHCVVRELSWKLQLSDTAANFQLKKVSMLKILNLTPNFFDLVDFYPQVCIIARKLSKKKDVDRLTFKTLLYPSHAGTASNAVLA